jgi:hypothetical protein
MNFSAIVLSSRQHSGSGHLRHSIDEEADGRDDRCFKQRTYQARRAVSRSGLRLSLDDGKPPRHEGMTGRCRERSRAQGAASADIVLANQLQIALPRSIV